MHKVHFLQVLQDGNLKPTNKYGSNGRWYQRLRDKQSILSSCIDQLLENSLNSSTWRILSRNTNNRNLDEYLQIRFTRKDPSTSSRREGLKGLLGKFPLHSRTSIYCNQYSQSFGVWFLEMVFKGSRLLILEISLQGNKYNPPNHPHPPISLSNQKNYSQCSSIFPRN